MIIEILSVLMNCRKIGESIGIMFGVRFRNKILDSEFVG